MNANDLISKLWRRMALVHAVGMYIGACGKGFEELPLAEFFAIAIDCERTDQ